MPTLIVPASVVGGISYNVKGLLKLQHHIPPYQRDYVWTAKVVEELWDDLIEHYKHHSVNESLENPEGYFIGAMVVVTNENNSPFEVVDGQQRLTTFSAIISVLFDLIARLDISEPYRTGFEQTARECLGQFQGSGWDPNLHFSDSDLGDFFLDSCLNNRSQQDKEKYWATPWCVQRLTRKNSAISRLREAIVNGYKKADAFLNEISDQDAKKNRLISFFRLVTECVVALRITAYSHSNAYAIFESLNNRGVRLSQADLIKNELLKIARPSERDDIVEHWTQARQNVDGTEFLTLPDFIHFSYLSRHGKTKANDLFESVKDLVSSGSLSASSYSQELYDDAIALDALTTSFQSSWTSETHSMLKDIRNVLGVKLCYPFLLAVYRKYSELPSSFEVHTKLVMNFAFRFLKVLEGGVDTLAAVISEASTYINDGKDASDIATLFRKHAKDAEFINKFETISFTNTKLAYFCVYYLEKAILQGTLPVPHGQDQNLEHIMPKTPSTANWPDMVAEKTRDPENYKEYLWRIGNLLPLPESINKSIKNKSILYKINNGTGNDYSSTTLESPKNVRNYLESGAWTFDSILKRQQDLAVNFAALAWPI